MKFHEISMKFIPISEIVKFPFPTYDTQDSRVVPHRSTDWAQQFLTSQFGWDAV